MGKTRRRGGGYDGQGVQRDGRGKGGGYEYWSRRPCSGCAPGRENKRLTHRLERARRAVELRRAMEPEKDDDDDLYTERQRWQREYERQFLDDLMGEWDDDA